MRTTRRSMTTYGQPVMGDYAPTLSPPVTATGQRTPCFAWQPLPGGRDGEQATDDSAYVAHRWHFLLPVGTAVAEDDQIADVRDEDDAVIVAGPLNVKEVVPRRGHTLARCDLAATGGGMSATTTRAVARAGTAVSARGSVAAEQPQAAQEPAWAAPDGPAASGDSRRSLRRHGDGLPILPDRFGNHWNGIDPRCHGTPVERRERAVVRKAGRDGA
jgi:hypothetical protein